MPPLTVASLATITTSRPRDAPMPVTMPAPGRVAVVEAVGGQRRELEERRARIEQAVDALADRQLALLAVACVRGWTAAGLRHREPLAQLGDQRGHARRVLSKLVGVGASLALHHVHGFGDCMFVGRLPPGAVAGIILAEQRETVD